MKAPAKIDFLKTGMLRQVVGKAVVAGTQSKAKREVQSMWCNSVNHQVKASR